MFLSTISVAQTNKRKAFQKYKEAKNLYYEQDYSKSVQLFQESILALGASNIKLQTLYVKALYKNNDWAILEKELPKYTVFKKKQKVEKDKEIDEIKAKLKSHLFNEKKFYQYARNLYSIKYFEEFLIDYPKSKYTEEIKEMLLKAKDEEAWLNYLNAGTLYSLKVYIKEFQNGKYIKEATSVYNKIDAEARNKANQQDTEKSYQLYLDTFENGKYREEIELKYKTKSDNNLYKSASNVNTIVSFKNYIKYL